MKKLSKIIVLGLALTLSEWVIASPDEVEIHLMELDAISADTVVEHIELPHLSTRHDELHSTKSSSHTDNDEKHDADDEDEHDEEADEKEEEHEEDADDQEDDQDSANEEQEDRSEEDKEDKEDDA